MSEQDLAYCGLDCGSCPLYISTVNNDNELRAKTFQEWSRAYGDILSKMGLDALKMEDMSCSGCKPDGIRFKGCMSCSIRQCSREKDFSTCADCDNYEKCELLSDFYGFLIHQPAKKKLDKIRLINSDRH
jgi:hypothetical protein